MKYLIATILASAAVVSFAMSAQAADIDDPVVDDPVVDDPVVENPAPADPSVIGLYLRGDIGWSILDVDGGDDDDNFVVGGGIGYQFSDLFRVDITADFSGEYEVAPGAEISTATVLGNLYFDWANDTMFTPYVGGGIGYGFVDGSGLAEDDDGVAYGAAAGVAVGLTNNLDLDLGYRFRGIDISGGDTQEHQGTVGMRVKF
jgi:opacity protein-like surface antigen